jgi:hypothetical protein
LGVEVGKFWFLVCFSLINLSFATAQSKAASAVVDLPRGETSRIPSPDRKWVLVFECPNNCSERKLSVEDGRTRARRLIRTFERSLSVSWAPDSRLFFVNDASGSSATLSYLYDPVTLKMTNLAEWLVSKDPKAKEYLGAGHSYLEARRWINSHELLVTLEGHTDQPPRLEYTLKYRVNTDGTVREISQTPATRR